jgi:hypothetical protein
MSWSPENRLATTPYLPAFLQRFPFQERLAIRYSCDSCYSWLKKRNHPRAGASLLTTNDTNWTNGEGNRGRMAIQDSCDSCYSWLKKGTVPVLARVR